MTNPKSPPISQDTAMLADQRNAWIKLLRKHTRTSPEGLRLEPEAVVQLADILAALRNPPPGVEREAEGTEQHLCGHCGAQYLLMGAGYLDRLSEALDRAGAPTWSADRQIMFSLTGRIEALAALSPAPADGGVSDATKRMARTLGTEYDLVTPKAPSPVAQAVEVERKAIENACAYLEADAGVWEEMAEKSHHREYASAAARLRREAAAAIRTPDPIASQTEGEGE